MTLEVSYTRGVVHTRCEGRPGPKELNTYRHKKSGYKLLLVSFRTGNDGEDTEDENRFTCVILVRPT